jgi:hypothetical protein
MREKTALLNSFFNGENLRKDFVFNEDCPSACTSMCFSICYNETDRLTCSENFVNGKENFYNQSLLNEANAVHYWSTPPICLGIREIVMVDIIFDSRKFEGSFMVDFLDFRMSLGAQH